MFRDAHDHGWDPPPVVDPNWVEWHGNIKRDWDKWEEYYEKGKKKYRLKDENERQWYDQAQEAIDAHEGAKNWNATRLKVMVPLY